MNIEKLLDEADLMVATLDYEKAITVYNQIIEKNRDSDEAFLMRGAVYGELGHTEKALNDVKSAISIDPEYDNAHLALALLYKAQGKVDLAIDSCAKAVLLNVNNREAIKNLIQLYEAVADQKLASHQSEDALMNYSLAIKYAPDNIHLLYKYAFTLSKMGNFDLACEYAEALLKKDSLHVPTLSLLTAIYEKTGELEKGWKLAEQLVEQYADNPSINITYAKYALRNKNQKPAVSRLLKVLHITNISIEDKLSIHMLLGKLYDALVDYKNAFFHFKQANELKYNDYDVSVFRENVSVIIDCFSKEKYQKIASSSNKSKNIIFILGMPRSGSSLIEQIISSHTSVYGGGELQHLLDVARKMDKQVGYPKNIFCLSENEMASYAGDFLQTMKVLSPEHKVITDKLPHNFEFIGLIHKLLPNAKIVNCIRNPVDTCLSCYFQHFGGYHPYAYNLSSLTEYYQQYSRLMKHWQDELNIPVLNVKYENLVQNTEEEVRALINYIDLDWEDSCLEFYKQKRAINTASYVQVKEKIYTKSINRWKNYESDIGELMPLLDELS
ncbi:MAG: sulfotransferase [Methylococcales bacterium]